MLSSPRRDPGASAHKPKPRRAPTPRNFGSLGDVFADKLKNIATKSPAAPAKRK